MILTGAEMAVRTLEENGVSVIFGYPGAANCPLIDRLASSKIRHILVRNEQGAAHMASGYARVTREVGVCTATSGPGATNLITGIATAYMDSVPIVALTGQVASGMVGSDAFQEVDITGATIPFTKHNYLIKNGLDIPRILNEAFYIAKTGRPGPVLIDMPMDILEQKFDYLEKAEPLKIRGYRFVEKANETQIKKAAEVISEAKKPVLLAGGGIVISKACKEFKKLAEELRIPVVSTMTGLGVLPCDHPLYYGMIGSHGKKSANQLLSCADLVVVLGARLGDRSIAHAAGLEKHARLIHVDIDPAEIGKNMTADIPVVGDVRHVLSKLIPCFPDYAPPDAWMSFAKKLRTEESIGKPEENGFVNPEYFICRLSEKTKDKAYVATEVGQNQIWVANHYCFQNPRRFITSAGFGTMGYGLPAAIGAKAAGAKCVIAVMGDGSFQMDLCELATMQQWKLPVKMVLFENHRLGMVHELQSMKYHSNYYAVELSGDPDFCKLAEAYGIPAEEITKNCDVDAAIERMLAADGAYLVVVSVNPYEPTGGALNGKTLSEGGKA